MEFLDAVVWDWQNFLLQAGPAEIGLGYSHLEFFVQQKKNMELMRAGQRRSITLSHASQDILVQSTLHSMQFIGLSAS